MTETIARQRLVELRAQLVRDKEIHAANMNAASGGIQVLDMLLAAPVTEPPEIEVPSGD